MMRIIFRIMLCILFFMDADKASAQWEVGEDVDMYLTSLKMYTYMICPPTPTHTHTFWFPVSEATGVNHVAIVDSVNTNGKVEIGLGNEVEVGDSIFIESTEIIPVYFYSDSGNVVLQFRAVGIPTQADEPVPCEKNDLWLMTFPLCNISNNPAFVVNEDTCYTEEAPSAVFENENIQVDIEYPSAINRYQLKVLNGTIVKSISIYSASGQLLMIEEGHNIDCSTIQSGIYILKMEIEGKNIGRKFSVLKY